MAESIKEQIVAKLAEAIASVSGVRNVQRETQAGIRFADVPFVILTQGEDILDQAQVRPNTNRRLEMYASIIIRQTDKDDLRSGDAVLNELGAEIEQALQSDRTVGGLATDVRPPDWLEVAIQSKVPHVGIALRFTVVYAHLRGDPFRQE